MEAERKVMEIITRLGAEEPEVPRELIESEAEKQGIENASQVIDSLVSQGLVMEQPGNKIVRIVKRLFW